MNLYEKYVLPKVVHCICGLKPNRRQRGKVIPKAKGRVLEIGIGSGLNLPHYLENEVTEIVGIDPTPYKAELLDAMDRTPIVTNFVQAGAENLDFDDSSFDTVVSTYTFCTIPELEQSLEELRRVLKPNGNLIFCEHGKAPDKAVLRTQNRINPIWKRLAGGCHLNRDIPYHIEQHGFKITEKDDMYLPGWKPATYNVWGVASIS